MSSTDLALVLVRLLIGCWLLWSLPSLTQRRSGTVPGTLDDVSVVIPARDEAANLPVLLPTIPDGVEVVVVDDHSCDDTAAVAAASGVRVVRSAALPEGWTGKAWACGQGAAAATGRRLVFVDADVRFAEGGLRAVVDTLDCVGGLVSVQPFHRPGRPVEQAAAIFNIVGLAGTDAATPLGRHRGVRGAFGPVLATSRSDYDAIGGHAAVRASIVDDVALAARYREHGRRVTVLGGGALASFRMYPRGLAQLIEGFTKNLAAGVRGVRVVTTLLVCAWLTLLVQASVAPVRTALEGDGAGSVVAVGLSVVVALQFWWMARRVGAFSPWVAATFPLSVGLFLLVFARSVVAATRGRVSWRGRRVPTRPATRR